MQNKKKSYPVPLNEKLRLKALYEFDILDTISEKEYDGITKIASQICKVPASFISFIDKNRQWYKSYYGVEMKEIPREISLCAHTIMNPKEVLVVPDMRVDDRFADNPMVKGDPHAVFYAGASLVTPDGKALGTICVLDAKANNLDDAQRDALKCLAEQVMTRLQLRQKIKEINLTQQKLKKANKYLKEFAQVVSHDMKTPLANILLVSRSFKIRYASAFDEDADEYLSLINKSAKELLLFIDNILLQSEKLKHSNNITYTDAHKVINNVIELIAPPGDMEIKIIGNLPEVCMEKTSLQQVFQNLITNAIKYNDKEKGIINIYCNSDNKYHYFNIEDNGTGIEEQNLTKIFKKKQTLEKTDRYGNKGTGIGLAKVKDIIENNGGKISVTSKKDIGSVFKICIPCVTASA